VRGKLSSARAFRLDHVQQAQRLVPQMGSAGKPRGESVVGSLQNETVEFLRELLPDLRHGQNQRPPVLAPSGIRIPATLSGPGQSPPHSPRRCRGPDPSRGTASREEGVFDNRPREKAGHSLADTRRRPLSTRASRRPDPPGGRFRARTAPRRSTSWRKLRDDQAHGIPDLGLGSRLAERLAPEHGDGAGGLVHGPATPGHIGKSVSAALVAEVSSV